VAPRQEAACHHIAGLAHVPADRWQSNASRPLHHQLQSNCMCMLTRAARWRCCGVHAAMTTQALCSGCSVTVTDQRTCLIDALNSSRQHARQHNSPPTHLTAIHPANFPAAVSAMDAAAPLTRRTAHA
jgi:hypothetical protein